VRYERERSASGGREAGFSLPEMLAVVALIGISIAIAIPLVNEQVRIAEIRGCADQAGLDMRAARMIAVSKHKSIVVTVNADPTNSYSYERTDGSTRTITMPSRVKITTGSSATVTFKSDGSTAAAGTVIFQSAVSTKTEQWTMTVNTLGLTDLAHARF
jgi:prepilin-type N-terminal cleavage/methylation domain-containing protein